MIILVATFIAVSGGHDDSAAGDRHTSDSAAGAGSGSLGSSGRIVVVASHHDRALAQESARRLRGRGLPAGVLDSDRYRPLRAGYHVVYIGPYPQTDAGRAAAQRIAARFPESTVTDVRAR